MEKKFVVRYTDRAGNVLYQGRSGRVGGTFMERRKDGARKMTRTAADGYAANPPVSILPGVVVDVVEA